MVNEVIGRILATEKNPTTIDEFTFWTKQDLILNPFDIVKVNHVNGSSSYGVIEDIAHITDAPGFLTNYISSDFGNVDSIQNTLRIGMNYVKAKTICNDKDIYLPLQNNSSVMLATKEEIQYALGLKNIQNPLVCGYISMYERTGKNKNVSLPIHLNSKFVIGPEGAHLNISGISGLAAKTSYSMFLLKAIQDGYINKEDEDSNADDDSVAFIMFNVKGKDLLAIDELNDFSDETNPEKTKEATYKMYKEMGLKPEPFKNVTYHFPFSVERTKDWNTYATSDEVNEKMTLNKASYYKYVYEYDKENLDLMFSNIDDTAQTMDSIINYIITEQGGFGKVETWTEFIKEVKKKTIAGSTQTDKEIPVVSWRKFYRIIRKAVEGEKIFSRDTDPIKHETRIEEIIKQIKKNEIHVIDIAKLSEDKQSFIFGDAMRHIYDLKLGKYQGEENVNPPSKIIIFIDELNKYASKDAPKNSPILKQVLDVAERGRSLGVILFSAEQFRSAIHDRVTGNCSTHAYGRTNSIEISKKDYSNIPSVYKTIITRLEQGEYIIQNPVFRSLLRIRFPKPIYRQFK